MHLRWGILYVIIVIIHELSKQCNTVCDASENTVKLLLRTVMFFWKKLKFLTDHRRLVCR